MSENITGKHPSFKTSENMLCLVKFNPGTRESKLMSAILNFTE